MSVITPIREHFAIIEISNEGQKQKKIYNIDSCLYIFQNKFKAQIRVYESQLCIAISKR